MNDALLVRGFECVGDLLGDREGFVEWNRATRNTLRQVVALDQFHHERGDALALFESVDGGDIRMIQRGEDPGFASESRQSLRIARERLRQDLDRHITIELPVPRPIDLAHTAAPEQVGQLEDAETGAWSEGQVPDYMGVGVFRRW